LKKQNISWILAAFKTDEFISPCNKRQSEEKLASFKTRVLIIRKILQLTFVIITDLL
jgi:hypothetical protein